MITIKGAAVIEALGEEVDWTFNPSGMNIYWNSNISPEGGLQFDGPADGDYAELSGCAEETFDAAVPLQAETLVTLYNSSDAGVVSVTVRDGDPVNFTFQNGDSEVTQSVIADNGSGFRLTNESTSSQVQINRIRVAVV